MKFETKFSVDDHAWFMKDNVPTEVIISAIRILFVNTNRDRICYNVMLTHKTVSWLDHANIAECELFKTKTDLMNHVFDEA